MAIYVYVRRIYSIIKNTPLGYFLIYGKNVYNNWFWKERMVGKFLPKKEKLPFIIRRYAQDMGIGSYIISNLSQINYAVKNEMFPVIDMLNYNGTKVNGILMNSWELYFNQPCSDKKNLLKKIYKTKNYRLSDGGCRKNSPNDSMDFLENIKKLSYWSTLYNQYCQFNDEMNLYAATEYNSLLKGKRVVGVLCRGTDYLQLKPKGHPVQPDVYNVINKLKYTMRKFDCPYVYLATEDFQIEKIFKSIFEDRLIINKRVYKNYKTGYLSHTHNERKNDLYYTNVEYLSSLYLLSRCDCFLAGRTSGTVIVLLMNYKYEFTYFWDLGEYV